MEVITYSDNETRQWGGAFARQLKGGDIVVLYGELGAGKTTLVKGVARGLGVAEEITSPTFTLMNVYEVKNLKSKVKKLIHIDTYRLKHEQELIDIGAGDYIGQPNTVTIIEWPEKLQTLLKDKKTASIKLENISANERKITLQQ